MKSEYIVDNFKFTPSTKLVFLDIDGVLNNRLYHEKRIQPTEVLFPEKGGGSIPLIMSDIDPINIKILNTLVEDIPDLYFVISSIWRLGNSIEELQKLFNVVGFKGNVIGKTPSLGSDSWGMALRGVEIRAWIRKYIEDYKFEHSAKYVIFDDDSDMLLWQKNNYFWIDPYVGITSTIAYQAKMFLKGESVR